MAIQLADKYSPIVSERFARGTVTNVAFNQTYDWIGVQTVKVYSVETVPMNDYTRSGMSRYGTPSEVQDTVQEMQLTQDRSFTATIDKGNNIDQYNIKGAGTILRRQIDEVIVPELDTYRLSVMAANAGETASGETPDETNAFQLFLKGQGHLGNVNVPEMGRVAFMTYDYYNMLKLDPSFVKQGDMSQSMVTRGVLGMVDGVPLIPVPSSRMPDDVNFILMHPIAGLAPVKLADYVIHDNPPGINGNLVEGRIYYDAFVLDSKKNAIYVSEK